jgi:hypothetical protein
MKSHGRWGWRRSRLPPLLPAVVVPSSPSGAYQVAITTSIPVNRMARRLEGNMGEYAGGRSVTVRGGPSMRFLPWLQHTRMSHTNYWCVCARACPSPHRSLNYECRLLHLQAQSSSCRWKPSTRRRRQSTSKRLIFLRALFTRRIDIWNECVKERPCLYVLYGGGNAPLLYSGDVQFESRTGHRLL